MNPSKQSNPVYKAMLSSFASKSEREIENKYRKYNRNEAKGLYLQVLIEIKGTIALGNIKDLRMLDKIFAVINKTGNKISLKSYFQSDENPIRDTNVIILACKHNKVKVLQYVLSSKCKILHSLSIYLEIPTIIPDDVDEECHNSFYYAIRSNNVPLLEALIEKWPDHYFDLHLNKLDEILSKTYEELSLKMIPLSGKMKVFVQSRLINLRFFSESVKPSFDNIKERIKLVIENITLLKNEYSGLKEVNMKFLVTAKFIAQNVHVLKRVLKPTYDRLPWEEMAFYLSTFIKFKLAQYGLNSRHIVSYILTKKRILMHLGNFAGQLNGTEICEFDISERFPNLKRETVVANIIYNFRPFEELYDDYEKVMNIYSLCQIYHCIQLTLAVNPKEVVDRLVITRVLQVIGEFTKNTLESPKLSGTTGELLFLSVSKNTREILEDVRKFPTCPLSKRTEIEEKCYIFFTDIQNDLKKMQVITCDILFCIKMQICRNGLKSIINSKNLQEIREVAQDFQFIEIQEPASEIFQTSEHKKIYELIRELRIAVNEKTDYEKALFDKINDIVNEDKASVSNESDNCKKIGTLKVIKRIINTHKIDGNDTKIIKAFAIDLLKNILPKMKPQSLKEINEMVIEIVTVAELRLKPDSMEEVNKLMLQIFCVSQYEIDDIEWIGLLRGKLTKSKFTEIHSSSMEYEPAHAKLALNEQEHNQLKVKVSTLKNILNDNMLNGELIIENYPAYKNNRKLQAAIEMLVQDIMSLSGSSAHLTNHILFLDDNIPFLIGKSLCDYLAHGNSSIDISFFDPMIAIVLNAAKLISEDVPNDKKCIRKLVKDNPLGLKEKFERDLQIVVTQEAMFTAIEEGNFEDLKISIKNGSDMNAGNVNLQTALHFAAKGRDLEILKFVYKDIAPFKDVDGQTPLHIAVAYGNMRNVKFFVKEGFNLNETNSNMRTPLHIAAERGYKSIVELLLKNGAETHCKDACGYSPVHYSITNNHKDITVSLLEKEISVDFNATVGDYTPLHVAADSGCYEIVLFLLQNKANVNAKSDRNWTPLHGAAASGDFEIAQTLILNGADVNVKILTDGYTSLHHAVQRGDESMVKLLLKHGANVNAAHEIYNFAPLHHAAMDGHVQVAEILIKSKANVNVRTVDGITPLHFAAKHGHTEMVDLLIKNGAVIEAKDSHGFTALHLSAYNDFKKVVELLIKAGAVLHCKDEYDRTPLHLAGMNGHKEVIELLIAEKVDVDCMDMFNSTTLHLSSINGHIDVMEVLIKEGAKVNAVDKENVTPLHLVSGTEMLVKCSPCIITMETNKYINKSINQMVLAYNADITAKGKNSENREVVKFLLDQEAYVNIKCRKNRTPLHLAALSGSAEIVEMLVKNNAKVNVADSNDYTPLHLAVHGNHRKVVEILIENGAEIDAKYGSGPSPLFFAIKYNFKEIVEFLLKKGANVNVDGGLPLAINCGFHNVVETLLKNEKINVQIAGDESLLHLAAKQGLNGIVQTLIKRGFDVNAITRNHTTPLYVAAQEGYKEVIEVLLENKANINIRSDNGFTPLHIAARQGHNNVVEFLLRNGMNIRVKDNINRTPIELATAYGHLQVVKILLRYKHDINSKGYDNWTILHIASQAGNLGMVRFLIDAGADINARNTFGSKPVHIAAREGQKDILQFFLCSGCHVDDRGSAGSTLLHYAAIGGQLEIAKYLIEQNVDINITNANDSTPLHLAVQYKNGEIVKYLLSKGAAFNAVNKSHQTPLDLANDKYIKNLLLSSDKLFKAVKCNSPSDVKDHIKSGAFFDAKNVDNVMPLHYAAWKGYAEVADVLLKAHANPNAVGNNGFTPLHYATKYSHLGIVKALLSNGAIYNRCCSNGKIPFNFAEHQEIVNLLKLVDQIFHKIQNNDSKIIGTLKHVKDIDTMKAIMNCCNLENKTLIVVAIHNNFSKIEELKQVFQGDVWVEIGLIDVYISREQFEDALDILRTILAKREQIFRPHNPAILEIQFDIAKVLLGQNKYEESLDMLEKIYEKQKEILGFEGKESLRTRSNIALILHKQGNNEDAVNIYKEVEKTQRKLLGNYDSDTLNTQCYIAQVLIDIKKYEEAIMFSHEVFENNKRSACENYLLTLTVQNNIALALNNQGRHELAIVIYKRVHEERKIIFGLAHSDCLRPLHGIGTVFLKQKRYDEALKALEEVFYLQKKYLGFDHLDALDTQLDIANTLFQQGKWFHAFKAYKSGFHRRMTILGPNHPGIIESLARLEVIEPRFKFEVDNYSDINKFIVTDIFAGVHNGDIKCIQYWLDEGTDVNARDTDGRTSLHFAAKLGHADVVTVLLKNGANAGIATNKGKTPLHSATSKNNQKIVEILLEHVKVNNRNEFDNFINYQTTFKGSAPLHIAAKNGYFGIIKCLLRYGAIYNPEDKNNSKTPFDYSENQNVARFFKLVDKLFKCPKTGNSSVIDELNSMTFDELQAISNARNKKGRTSMQVAVIKENKFLAKVLIKLLKRKECS